MAEPNSLFYYPRSPSAWLERTAGLSPLARAAFADLEGQAWTAPKRGAVPCSLPDDDAALARMARLELREWKKVSAEVRALYMYRDGVLVDEMLLKTWNSQQTAYTKRVEAGDKGNKAKALRRQSERNASAEREQSELELEGKVLPAPVGAGENHSPPTGDARGAEGAALPAAANGTGNYLDRPEAREELLRRGVRPEQLAAASRDSRTIAEVEAETNDLHKRHWAAVRVAADAWIAANPDEASGYEREVREGFGFPVDGSLTRAQEVGVREAVYGEIVARHGWPAPDEWDGEPFTARSTPTPAGASR